MIKHIEVKEFYLYKQLKTKIFKSTDNKEYLRYFYNGVYVIPTNIYLPLDVKYYIVRTIETYGIKWFIGYFSGGVLKNSYRLGNDEVKTHNYELKFQRLYKIEKIRDKISKKIHNK